MDRGLIGREPELAMLRLLLADARGGRGRSCVVVGPEGVGKTTLLGGVVGEAAALGSR